MDFEDGDVGDPLGADVPAPGDPGFESYRRNTNRTDLDVSGFDNRQRQDEQPDTLEQPDLQEGRRLDRDITARDREIARRREEERRRRILAARQRAAQEAARRAAIQAQIDYQRRLAAWQAYQQQLHQQRLRQQQLQHAPAPSGGHKAPTQPFFDPPQ
jgi:hypothetical protein